MCCLYPHEAALTKLGFYGLLLRTSCNNRVPVPHRSTPQIALFFAGLPKKGVSGASTPWQSRRLERRSLDMKLGVVNKPSWRCRGLKSLAVAPSLCLNLDAPLFQWTVMRWEWWLSRPWSPLIGPQPGVPSPLQQPPPCPCIP